MHTHCLTTMTMLQASVVTEWLVLGKSVTMATLPAVMAVHPHAQVKVP